MRWQGFDDENFKRLQFERRLFAAVQRSYFKVLILERADQRVVFRSMFRQFEDLCWRQS